MAHKVEELPLYQRVDTFAQAVSVLLRRGALRRNRKLWDQLADANDSMVANFAEGFEQGTDAAFANYLLYSKGSVAEVIKRLKQAERRGALQRDELERLEGEAEEIGRMLGGFINYLKASNFKNRGTHKRTPREKHDSKDSKDSEDSKDSRMRDSRISD